MTWRCLTLAVCVTIPLLAQDADPTPPDAKRIRGTWSVVKGMKDGKPAPRELMDGKFIIDGETISIKRAVGTGESPVKYKLDPKKKPAEIDLAPPAREPVKDAPPPPAVEPLKGIYKFEKDELTLVFTPPGKARPTTFDDKAATSVVLKRDAEKKEK